MRSNFIESAPNSRNGAFLVFTVGIGGFRGELERLAAGAGSVYGELSFTFEMQCSDSCVMYLIEVYIPPYKMPPPTNCDVSVEFTVAVV